MKTLYVMRHAKSSWKEPDLQDHQRPLNRRGKRDLSLMGRHLQAMAVPPDLVVTSDARRALDTAIPIAGMLGVDPSAIRREAGLYHATDAWILALVKSLEADCRVVMIVGHNPGLNDFVNRFLDPPLRNLPTAGIVSLAFAIALWPEIDPRRLAHSSFDRPKNRI